MALRLDPDVPLVWRSPTSLQLGVDGPVAVLSDVTSAQERMIAALTDGVSRQGLAMIGLAAGAGPDDVGALLTAIEASVIETKDTDPPSWHVALDGQGPTLDRIAALLGASGHRVSIGDAEDLDPRTGVDLAVVVAHYAITPSRYGGWLRRDIPHLSVVFSDSTIRIGPLVEPGGGPCLYCIDRTRTDADPAWPAIASQLIGRRASSETALLGTEVALRAARIVLGRLGRNTRKLSDTSLRLDARTGRVSAVRHPRHADCGCRVLPGNVTALSAVRADRSATRKIARGSARA